MLKFAYLLALLFSLFGILLLDKRYKLAAFFNISRTLTTLATVVVVFIIWDILGIKLGIFFSGHSPYMSGVYLAPDFPIEEIFFLIFLCYFTLIMYRLAERRWRRT